MVASHSVTLDGLAGRPIEVEVDIANGLPTTIIVGLADTTINEARNRVRSAVVNSGTNWPDQRVTINLAPSTLPKSGSHYDLAIAVAMLASKSLVPIDRFSQTVFLGELALDGRLRAIRGVLPATLAAAESGFDTVFVPEINAAEAQIVAGIEVVGVRSLRHTMAVLRGEDVPEDPPVAPLTNSFDDHWASSGRVDQLDLEDVAGQTDAVISAVIAAAGGHHMMLVGPPGIGKTMIAQRLPALLPDLSIEASIEASAIHSIAGVLPAEAPLMNRPPFLDPHHSASAVSIVGGGTRSIRPGAMALAHHGVLFLDEAPEFASNVLEALRQPLESGRVLISRASASAHYPARFQLVLAANPCPCGHGGSKGGLCECTTLMARRYADRISGPIRDRIDIQRTLHAPARSALADDYGERISSAHARDRVLAARKRQEDRWANTPWRLNTDVPGAELRKHWPPTPEGRRLVDRQLMKNVISARAADRILRLAWTIADICEHDQPTEEDVAGALALRRGAAIAGELRALVEVAA